MEGFQERFEAFKPVFEAKVLASYAGFNSRCGYAEAASKFVFEYQEGPKYIRIVKKEGSAQGGSAFGFIEKATGNLLKPAGWKGPAKNFARGNIFAEDFGIARLYWTGVQ